MKNLVKLLEIGHFLNLTNYMFSLCNGISIYVIKSKIPKEVNHPNHNPCHITLLLLTYFIIRDVDVCAKLLFSPLLCDHVCKSSSAQCCDFGRGSDRLCKPGMHCTGLGGT